VRFFPVVFTASRKAEASNAFIEGRSTARCRRALTGLTERGTVEPYSTPTVERTIGMPNALAVFARRRTCSSARSAFVSERMTSNISFW
jgi:hypothetical protein